ALAVNSPTELPLDPETTTRESDRGPWSVSAAIQNPTQIPVLADGLFVHSTRPTGPMDPWEGDVQLPNINCRKCTLQVVQFMADHGFNNPGGYSYHHCANLQITADPAQPLSPGWPAEKCSTRTTAGREWNSRPRWRRRHRCPTCTRSSTATTRRPPRPRPARRVAILPEGTPLFLVPPGARRRSRTASRPHRAISWCSCDRRQTGSRISMARSRRRQCRRLCRRASSLRNGP